MATRGLFAIAATVGSLLAPSVVAIELPPEIPQRVAEQIRIQLGGGAAASAARVAVLPSESSLPEEAFEVACADGVQTTVRGGSRRALLFGLYELARQAGFGFLHPLHVVTPSEPAWCQNLQGRASPLAEGSEAGAIRGTHLHTQHPIELANVLNGVGHARTATGATHPSEDEAVWAAGLPMWTSYLQWLVASKQNFVEWALLEWGQADGFSMSQVRQRRLAELITRAQEWGLKVAIDAPINLQQQHAWRIQNGKTWETMAYRLDWLCALGLDEVSTEIGSTEFSHTDPHETVALLNKTVAYLAAKGKRLVVKNHASTKQVANGYTDPLDPSKDLNFNYITYYADPRIVSAPHTIQMYSLADPLAGSYGRQNYSDIKAMMTLQDQKGKNQVFFPETAYWVDFDNSVPVFLPLYAADRLRDLQLLARDAPHAGHLNFESGWAFGYWVNNAAQAYAAWHRDAGLTPAELFQELLKPLGPEGAELAGLLLQLAVLQNQTLVQDVFLAPSGARQTLMGYFEGWDGMAEAQEAWQFAVVQPPRVHPRDILDHADWYLQTLAPRLHGLWEQAKPLSDRCRALRTGLNGTAGPKAALIQDACVGVELFALRAQQVNGVYAAASGSATERGIALSAGAIEAGLALIQGLDLQPEWTQWTSEPWPTAYPYGYLWPAASLFFWRRDHQIVAKDIRDPCYLNLYDIVQLGLPYSDWKSALQRLAQAMGHTLSWLPWSHKYAGCFHGPTSEPELDPVSELFTAMPPLPPKHLYF